MTIGFDAKRLFHNKTGLGNYSRTLVRNLYRYFPDHAYHLFSSTHSLKDTFFNQPTFTIHQNGTMPAALWRSQGQVNLWKQERIQIYHGLSNELPFTTSNSTATVVTIHDFIFKTLPRTYSLADRQLYHLKVKSSCQKADAIIAISQHTKKDLCQYYGVNPDRIQVIYQAVQDIYYEVAAQDKKITSAILDDLPDEYFLCVGTLEKRKNQLQLLKAWQQLESAYQLPIVLVGRGKSYVATLKKYAHQNKIPVIFLNNITATQDLIAIYQQATLFIYPSLYEGFGLPIVEAQLSGVPVITSNTSSMVEASGPATELVNPTNTTSLVEAIQLLLADQEGNDQRIQEGRKFVLRTFHPKLLSTQMVSLYEKLVS